MANGDTKTNQYLDIAAHGTRADFPASCCETRSQTLIREVGERIMDVEDEVEELKNNPDVVDIVATYADLQAYDTQHLTDKDIIRVLQDETHDGESTYYRYNKQSDTWTYIGESKQYDDFVGTDGTTAGEAGLVPAPATTDAGKFLKADGTWDDAGSTYTAGDGIDITNDVIKATNTGKARVLTTDDYNYPTSNPDSVALWLLDAGTYTITDSNVYVRISSDFGSRLAEGALATVSATDSTYNRKTIIVSSASSSPIQKSTINLSTGATFGTAESLITRVRDTLTSTEYRDALSANQGKVLNDKIGGDLSNLTTTDKTSLINAINEVAGQGGGGVTELTSADYNWPTSNPDGVAAWLLEPGLYYAENAQVYMSSDQIGDRTDHGTFIIGEDYGSNPAKLILYYNQVAPAAYLISTVISSGYRSSKTSLLSPNVTQSTGTSTSSVMSQDAVTSMVFADPSAKTKVRIGSGSYVNSTANYGIAIGRDSQVTGVNGIAIGNSAFATAANSIAIGPYSPGTISGGVDFGTTVSSFGYNNSNYRLLTGLYDPQSAHDAATKGYVDPTTDSSAPTTATVGRLGQIQIDTTTNTAYMCVAVDNVTPAYTWKQITA